MGETLQSLHDLLEPGITRLDKEIEERGDNFVNDFLMHVHALSACYVSAWQPTLSDMPWAAYTTNECERVTLLRLYWAMAAARLPGYEQLAEWIMTHPPPPAIRNARIEFERTHGPGTFCMTRWQRAPLRVDMSDATLEDSARSLRMDLTSRIYHGIATRIRMHSLTQKVRLMGLPLPEFSEHLRDIVKTTVPVDPRDARYLQVLHRATIDPAQPYGSPILGASRTPLLELPVRAEAVEGHYEAVRQKYISLVSANRTALLQIAHDFLRQINVTAIHAVLASIDCATIDVESIRSMEPSQIEGLADDYDAALRRALSTCVFAPMENLFATSRDRSARSGAEDDRMAAVSPRLRAMSPANVSVAAGPLARRRQAMPTRRGKEPQSAWEMMLPVHGVPSVFDACMASLIETPRYGVGVRMQAPPCDTDIDAVVEVVQHRLEAIVEDAGAGQRVAVLALPFSGLEKMRARIERLHHPMIVCLVWDDETHNQYGSDVDPAQSPLWSVHIVWNNSAAPWVEAYQPTEEPPAGWGAMLQSLWPGRSAAAAPGPSNDTNHAQQIMRAAMGLSGDDDTRFRILDDMSLGCVTPTDLVGRISRRLASHSRHAHAASQTHSERVFQVTTAPEIRQGRAHNLPVAPTSAPGLPLTFCMWYAEMRIRGAPLCMCMTAYVESLFGKAFVQDYLCKTYYNHVWCSFDFAHASPTQSSAPVGVTISKYDGSSEDESK